MGDCYCTRTNKQEETIKGLTIEEDISSIFCDIVVRRLLTAVDDRPLSARVGFRFLDIELVRSSHS